MVTVTGSMILPLIVIITVLQVLNRRSYLLATSRFSESQLTVTSLLLPQIMPQANVGTRVTTNGPTDWLPNIPLGSDLAQCRLPVESNRRQDPLPVSAPTKRRR